MAKEKIEGRDNAPSTFLGRLTAGKTFHRGAEKPRGCSYAALIPVFKLQILNNSFYALGYVELWKRSQKLGGL
jgi:hypothetical protein